MFDFAKLGEVAKHAEELLSEFRTLVAEIRSSREEMAILRGEVAELKAIVIGKGN